MASPLTDTLENRLFTKYLNIRPFQVVSIQKVCEANKRSLRFLVKAMVDKLLKKVRYVCKRVCGCLSISLHVYTPHVIRWHET